MDVRFARIDDDRLAEKSPTHWREKAAKMRFERGRRQELAVGGLLVEMTGIVDPVIVLDENGKPSFRDHPEIHFSLSHSGDYVMCAISDSPIGCDIEKDAPLDEDVKKEVGSIAEWTLKEAAFKCGKRAEARLVSAPTGYFAAVASRHR